MSPVSSDTSGSHSPVTPNKGNENSKENQFETTRFGTEKNEAREMKDTLQFCTLPRKKKSIKGGALKYSNDQKD